MTKEQLSEVGYEELVQLLEDAPTTQIPALFAHIVQIAVRKKVFRAGGIAKLAQTAENKERAALIEVLRESKPQPVKDQYRSTVRPGDTVQCECGKGHTWLTEARPYWATTGGNAESWQPRKNRCPICNGVYLVAQKSEQL